MSQMLPSGLNRSRGSFISQFFHPLDVPCIVGFARALAQRGCDIDVVAARLSRDWPCRQSWEGTSVTRVEPPSGRLGRLRYFGGLIKAAVNGPRPDFVIGNFLDIHGAAAILTAKMLRVPCAVVEHGSGVHEAHVWPWRDRVFHRFCLLTVPLVIALSGEDQVKLRRMARRPRIEVVPCPFFPPPFEEAKEVSREKLHLDRRAGHLVLAGRLVEVGGKEQKGTSIAIQAMTRLPGCHLHVLGDGPLKPRLQALVAELRLATRVTFHGHIARQGVLRFMNAAEAVLVPSLYEPLGMVILEAMFLRTPLVVSNVGGPRHYLRPAVDALMVEPGDAAGLAEAVTLLLSSPQVQATLCANAVSRLAEHFEPRAVAERLLAFLSPKDA